METLTMHLGRRPFQWWLGFSLLLTAISAPFLSSLFGYAINEKLHSHIVLIPFVSAYLIYLKRQELPLDYTRSWWATGVSLLIAAAGWSGYLIWGERLSENDSLALKTFVFLSLLVSGGFLFLGRQWMARLAFPIGFLIFMVPLPDIAVEWLERFLQLGSSEMVHILFNVAGLPVFRDGTTFQLPGIVLEVARECSGIRSTWVLFITSLLASYMFLNTQWKRAVLVGIVLPLAILRNGIRILVIGLLCVHIGPHMIHSIFHRRGGPLFFALSLIPLFLLMWWLYRSERTNKES